MSEELAHPGIRNPVAIAVTYEERRTPPVPRHNQHGLKLDAIAEITIVAVDAAIDAPGPKAVEPGLVRGISHGADTERRSERGIGVAGVQCGAAQCVAWIHIVRIACCFRFDPTI